MLGAHGVQAGSLGPLVAWAASVLIYTIPSQLLRQVAQSRAERWLPAFLRGAHLFDWIVAPLSDPLYFAGQWLSRSRQREPSATLTETEVEILVNEGELNGSLAHDQSEMIRNVLDFGEVTAEELMVPRTQVDALDATFTLEQALAEVIHSQHSRYPVFCDSVDNIAGILHVKDLFQALAQDAASPDSIVRGGLTGREPEGLKLLDLARKPVAFVPEGQLASTVLRDMRAGRHHMAVVLDEFGGVSGVLTLEDLLEEIVGDIQDEHDLDDQQRILMLSEHTALVDASTPVADINRAIGTDLPDGDYVSLGGLLLEELGTVPAQGSTFELHGLRVVIRESDDRHIARVELSDVPGTPRDPTTRPPASAA
jgi:CBS domain containing-hemolysin-like protein